MVNIIRYVALVAMISLQSPTIFAQPSTSLKNLPLDLAIVLHAGMQADGTRSDKVLSALLQQLPTIFQFGENLTRVTVVANEAGRSRWNVEDFSGDQTKFEKDINATERTTTASQSILLAGPFNDLRGEFEKDPNRTKAILLLTTSVPAETDVGNRGKRLRDAGVWIFVITDTASLDDQKMKEIVTGDFNIIKIPDLTTTNTTTSDDVKKALNEFKEKIDQIFCFNATEAEACFYNDGSSTCSERLYHPEVPESIGDCYSIVPSPPPGSTCDVAKCEEFCKKTWPFGSPCDPTKYCGEAVLVRIGKPKWKQLQFCPNNIACVPCVTTPAPTTTVPTTEFDHNAATHNVINNSTTKRPIKGTPWWGKLLGAIVVLLVIAAAVGSVVLMELREKKVDDLQARLSIPRQPKKAMVAVKSASTPEPKKAIVDVKSASEPTKEKAAVKSVKNV